MEDLFSKIGNLSSDDKAKLKHSNTIIPKSNDRGKRFVEETLKYEVYDSDPELVSFVKELINENEVTNKEVYDTYGKSIGYNMMYSLTKDKPAIAWDRVRKWCDLLGYELELVVTRKK